MRRDSVHPLAVPVQRRHGRTFDDVTSTGGDGTREAVEVADRMKLKLVRHAHRSGDVERETRVVDEVRWQSELSGDRCLPCEPWTEVRVSGVDERRCAGEVASDVVI